MIFKETNIGLFIVASFSELLNGMQLSGLSLVVITFLVVAISSFFVPMASTKWAMLSPVIVPMFMQASMTPEFAMAVLELLIVVLRVLLLYLVILLFLLVFYIFIIRERMMLLLLLML